MVDAGEMTDVGLDASSVPDDVSTPSQDALCRDERCECDSSVLVNTTFEELRTYGGICQDGDFEYCRQAAQHLCDSTCAKVALGPFPQPDGGLNVLCVPGDRSHLTHGELHAFDPACSGLSTSEPIEPIYAPIACRTAAHRYCASVGAVSGSALLALWAVEPLITCVDNGTIITTTYTELAAMNENCDGIAQVQGADCDNAAHIICTQRAYAGGFGPVEVRSDHVEIACVD